MTMTPSATPGPTPGKPQPTRPALRIGSLSLDAPVVLAPMAGVTNAPFRTLCRRYGAGLYVSEMVLARSLLEGGMKSWQRVAFAEGEWPRSMQLYGSDPVVVGEAVRLIVGEGLVDHVDMNFGCPAPKVTRKGGGSAVPAKPKLLRAIVAAATHAANAESGGRVPVTIKFRIGIDDSLITFLDAGRIGEDEGCAAVSLHARTAEQRYSGKARWSAIGELKQAVTSIPVLGNGDIWDAPDALAMMAETGCDGVVIGRGCLGRPWLFRDLVDVFNGRPVKGAPTVGELLPVLREHAELLVAWYGDRQGIRDFRKHPGWYFTGYAVGPDVRRRMANLTSLADLDDVLATIDPSTPAPAGPTIPRGHTNGPKPVHLPENYLKHLDDDTPPSADADMVSGG
jgi:nifR3 family TIM-barrel protein